MANTIAVGNRVEADLKGDGTISVGTVLETSERKSRVQFDDSEKPESVFNKYLTVVAKGKKPKAAKAPKAPKEPKAPRVAKALGIVPLVRQDGETSKSIVAGADLSHYKLHTEVKTASGRPSIDIGDRVAEILRGKSTEEAIKITATELTRITGETVTQTALRTKYEHLNPGQIRMNLGNRLRAAFRADEAATATE